MFSCFSPPAESFGVSAAQIGAGPEVRFHQVVVFFNQGSAGVPRGSARAAGWCEH